MLINSNLPLYLWGEAILTACYLYNRTPNSSINFKTPYKYRYKEVPNLDNIRVFSSLTYYKEPTSLIKKLDSRATPYYLVGFSSNSYKLYNITTNKVVYARDCKILEGYYYRKDNSSNINKIFTKIEDLSKEPSKVSSKAIIKYPKVVINRAKEPIPKVTNSTIIVEDSSNSLDIKDYKNIGYNTIYNNLVFNILITSNSLEEPKSLKEVLLREDKDLYLKAI